MLLGHTSRIAKEFFEPLIDLEQTCQLILPAADELWYAKTESTWRDAQKKAQQSQYNHITIGEAFELMNQASSTKTLNSNGQSIGTERYDVPWRMEDISHLTLSIIGGTAKRA